MASPQRGRHAHRPARRPLPRVSPTVLAMGGLVVVFAVASLLTVHVLNVPSHLRQEGADGPASAPGHSTAASARTRPLESRAARAAERTSPTPSPTPSPTARPAVASATAPAPAPHTSSARPSPRPSPSSSSGGPLPLPTLTAKAR